MVNTVIKNCKVVSPQGSFTAGLAIDGEKIVAVARDEDLPQAHNIIDARGNYVIPGLVDTHVHMSVLRRDFDRGIDQANMTRSETRGCALGGITTAVAMMIRVDATDIDVVKFAKDFVTTHEKNSYVDLGLTSYIFTKNETKQIRELAEFGVAGFKLLTPYKGPDTLGGVPSIDDGIIYATFTEIAKLAREGYKIHAKIHCENVEIFFSFKDDYISQGIEPSSWHEVRPSFLEVESIQRAIYLANQAGCPLYIVHMSVKEGVDIVARAKANGIEVIAETCPYLLALNVENTDKVIAKVDPPIRTREDNEKLWEGIRRGVISVIATDHSTPRKRDKEGGLWKASPAFSGVETWLPVMLSEGVNKGRITLEKLVEVCCYNPANISGLAPRKGVIGVGSDADLVIVDLNKEAKVADKPVYTISDITPFAGWKLKGWPVLTMVRGNIVMEQGKVIGQPGIGRYIAARVK